MSKDTFAGGDGSNITSEACAWIAQLETGELTVADQDAFREWISRSPRHASEIRYQAEMSIELNLLSGMAYSINEATHQHSTAVSRKRPRSRFLLGSVVAASVAIFLFFATIFLSDQVITPIETAVYRTAVGEYREITLSDGSIVRLNTDSQIEVTFDKGNRRVRLLNGEAFFEVASNTERPFWVYTNDQYVRVVGTAFLVSLLDRNFELMVTEGRVELASSVTPAASEQQTDLIESANQIGSNQLSTVPIALVAGQSISVSETKQATPVQTMSETEQRRELSWREGLHEFSNDSLEDVVRELSRHNGLKIEITDPELREIKFGGVFRIGETQQLFDALEAAYGVEVAYLDKTSVRLSRSD